MCAHIIISISLVIVGFVCLGLDTVSRRRWPPPVVRLDEAKECCRYLSDFGKWMVTIDTAAIAAMGFLLKDLGVASQTISRSELWAGSLAAQAFALSIVAGAWVVSAVHSVSLRLTEGPSTDNSVLDRRLYDLRSAPAIAAFAFVQHTFFVMGIVGLVAFAVLRLETADEDREMNRAPSLTSPLQQAGAAGC